MVKAGCEKPKFAGKKIQEVAQLRLGNDSWKYSVDSWKKMSGHGTQYVWGREMIVEAVKVDTGSKLEARLSNILEHSNGTPPGSLPP